MFPLDISYLRPSLGDDNRLYWRYINYISKILAIEPGDLLAYWPQNEVSGTDADNAEGTAARDGTYSGATLGQAGIGDGETSVLYDGVNDTCSVYSASLTTPFDPTKGTIAAWGKVLNAGVWTDGSNRSIFSLGDNADAFTLRKRTANNSLRWIFDGQTATVNKDKTHSGLSWFHMALTWDSGADEYIPYFNGVQEGVIQTGVGLGPNTLRNGRCQIGSRLTAAEPWKGYAAHAAVWGVVLTPAQILVAATV